jgi:predicted dehydrogenase
LNFTVLGFGARGSHYADIFSKINGVKLTAVCEIRSDRLEKAGKLYGLQKDKLFFLDKEFAAAGKLGDLCIVSTQDDQHLEHASTALDAGYDLLLEKPIAVKWNDCLTIYERAKKLKRRVFVCHVLRYAPFFRLIKEELDAGAYGKPAAINLTENVAYWHQAHSYVRGNWRTAKTAAPMIVAKCCHDLDIIAWLANNECKAVSSMGSLGFYTKEKAPADSSDRCLTCAIKADCPYDAEKLYMGLFNEGKKGWPVDVLCEVPTRKKILSALKDGPYGRCVWRCDNDVVDRQIVNMEFVGGLAAHLTMTAFSQDCYREIHVHCEKGEIFGNMRDNVLTCNVYGKSSKKIDVKCVEESNYAHGGGDYLLLQDIAAAYNGQKAAALTSIENSLQSHAIGFAAEASRLDGGELIKLAGEYI